MQGEWEIKHCTQLFENERTTSNSLFLKLQKNLTKLLNSLELVDKDFYILFQEKLLILDFIVRIFAK